mmetsp:Transcript_30507/g.39961  ORF Transcript_30507/g.39961 Transcript_30507/m.39961 type:complete len:387 (-) Transcript_30507:743-1903(-)
MQETFQDIHHEQDTKGNTSKDTETNVGGKPVNVEGRKHSLLPENSGKFTVSQRQGPKTKVRSSVGNHTQHKLNSLDGLVDNDFSKAVFFIVIVIISVGSSFFVVVDSMGNLALVSMLLRQQVGLSQKKNRDRSKGNEQQKVLDAGLSVVHGFVDNTRLKSNVDQGSDKIGWLTTVSGTTIVKRTLGGSVISSSTFISPRSTGTISGSLTISPFSFIIGGTPAIASGIDTCGGKHARIPVDRPLHENENNHVHKEGRSKGNHGQKLEKEIELLSKVDGVQTLEACTGKHLDDTKDNRKLHLERVEKEQLIGGHMPHRIKTKRIDGISTTVFGSGFSDCSSFDFTRILSFKGPTRSKQVKTKREAIVVNKTGINSEETHHGNHVTSRV